MTYVTDAARIEAAFPALCLRIVMKMIQDTCPLKPDAPEQAHRERDEFFNNVSELLQASVDAAFASLPVAHCQKLERRTVRRVASVFGPIGETTPLVALKTCHEVVQAILNTGNWEPDEYYIQAFNAIADFVYSSPEAVAMVDRAEHEAVIAARGALRRLQRDGYYR
jgi:hypothetical protein